MAYISHAPVVGRLPSPSALIAAAANRFFVWSAVMRERRALREMGLSRLEDLGLTDTDVKRETRKPFWWTRRNA
ncbi:MAG: hypothetical protein AAFU55_04485 [Pseudomonadota bacterium]